MPGIRHLAVCSLLCLPVLLHASTWKSGEVKDPITFDTLKVSQIAATSPYIYYFPSKYDYVFWPYTDGAWIWFNPKSGYGAFGDHFSTLDEAESEKIRAFLAANYDPKNPPITHQAKLLWLERLYEQRQVDERFRCLFYRLMAFMFRDDEARAKSYTQKAFDIAEKRLAAGIDDKTDRAETLYVIGEYARRLGDAEKARTYLQQAIEAPYVDPDTGAEKVGQPLIVQLATERLNLIK